MSEKYIALDLNDEKSLKIAEVIGNKTSKAIINLLADGELSESEIANELKIPLNTAHYNVKKLVDSGLVEKKSGFLWSVKGRKIEKYRLANKKILISPKRMTKGVIPVLIATAVMTFLIKLYTSTNNVISTMSNNMDFVEKSANVATSAPSASAGAGIAVSAPSASIQAPQAANVGNIINNIASTNVWAWFLLGALFAVLIYLVYDLINERGQI